MHRILLAITAFAIILAGYTPWAAVPIRQLTTIKNYYEGTIDILLVARRVANTLVAGEMQEEWVNAIGVLSFTVAALAALGLPKLGALSRRSAAQWRLAMDQQTSCSFSQVFVVLWLAVPIALALVLLTLRPKFSPQYLLWLSPAVYFLLAQGVLMLFRSRCSVGVAAAGLLLASTTGVFVSALANYYFNPAYARDDWRGVAQLLRAERQRGDGIVLISGYAAPALRYYYGGDDWLAVPDRPVMSVYDVVDVEETKRVLESLKDRRRVWLVLWQDEIADPNRLINRMLERVGERTVALRFGAVKVERYDLTLELSPSLVEKPDIPLEVNFENKMRLLGLSLGQSRVPAGDTVKLALYWEALMPLAEDYHVVVRLTDDSGLEWGKAVKRPASYMYDTRRWRVGSTIAGDVSLQVLPGTPPGQYQLRVGLFSVTTMRGLEVIEGNSLKGPEFVVGRLAVVRPSSPPSYTDLGITASERTDAGRSILFLGAQPSSAAVRAGGTVDITTFWEPLIAPGVDLVLRLRIVDGFGNELGRQWERPVGDKYPTTVWTGGERLRGQHRVTIPGPAEGTIRITGQLFEAAGNGLSGAEFTVANIRLLSRSHNTTRSPAPQVSQRAVFGDTIRLLGYTIPQTRIRAGDTVRLRLYWQSITTTSASYKVFTHLLDMNNHIVAQDDSVPGRGALPTPGWIPGEFIEDDYELRTRPGLPSGAYLLEIGFYSEATGERLQVTDAAGAAAQDHVFLTEPIYIVPD